MRFKKHFDKSFQKLPIKIQDKFNDRLIIFEKNQFERALSNHNLTGKYIGYKSINITGDYRAIFKEYPNGSYEFVDFIDIGTHSQLYK